MSLRISSHSSRFQVGFSGGLFGVEVPFLGGMFVTKVYGGIGKEAGEQQVVL
jgi:hypothetical protein